jgi:sec-independent protein translocase protein TatA
MFGGLFQPTHLILILVVVLIIFGPGKLPEVGKAIGKGIREIKKAASDETNENKTELAQQEEKGSNVVAIAKSSDSK